MIRRHLRTNIVGYVALFIALTAGAYAAGLPKNSVKSATIKDGQVKNADLASDSVDSSKVADGSLTNADFGGSLPAGETGPQGIPGSPGSPDTGAQILGKLAPVDGAGSGLDADEIDDLDSGALVKSGDTAGGDLAGTYPNPQLGPGTVGTAERAATPAVRVSTPKDASDCFLDPSVPGDGTLTPLAFTFEDYDVGGMHDNTNCPQRDRLVAPVDGLYLITGSIVWEPQTGGSRFAGIEVNGNDFLVASRIPGLAAGEFPEQELSTVARLNADSFVRMVISQSSGSTILLNSSYTRDSLQMTWIAP